jgi:tRNA pseudouridine38-40 synthase
VAGSFRPLDGDAMRAAAAHLIGEHDFSSFRAAECQSPTPVKTLRGIDIDRRGAYWRFDFDGKAFLHHMVRNIMGCLVMVGSGRQRPTGWPRCWLRAAAKPQRPRSRPTACTSWARTTMPAMAFPTTCRRMDWLP